MIKELDYTQARKTCPRDFLKCNATDELEPLIEIIGQDRAVKALQFGLDIKEEGFNLYVAGMPGTGKKTALIPYLEQRAKDMPVPSDWCYVYNFEDGQKPNALQLPAGLGSQLVTDMAKFIEEMKKSLTSAFESDDYASRREDTLKGFEEEWQLFRVSVD